MAATKLEPKRSLSLANVRDPREAKLSPTEKKQWKGLVAREGLDDDETSVQLVDVVEGSAIVYQLYLWSFGSAALFPAGKTKAVGGAEQHAFHADDAELCAALATAWKASAKRLKLREALTFEAAKKTPAAKKPAPKGGGIASAIAALRALVKDGKGREASRAADALRDQVFPPWRHYPKLLADELSADQRAVLEVLLELDLARDLASCGLFDRDDHLERFLGRSRPGPSDVTIALGKRTVPVWWAVSAVGSGHTKPDEVLKGWRSLPADKALAAWTEVARDGAYDVLTARATSMKDAGFSAKPYMVDYRTRIVALLADVSFAFGPEGEKAAKALTTKLPSWGGAWQIFVALASGLRHAKGAPLDTAYDKTFTKLWERVGGDAFYASGLETEIEKALPEKRAKAFRAGLTQPGSR